MIHQKLISWCHAGRIIEVIAQPIGPQKLARVLHRCLQRIKMLAKSSEAFSTQRAPLPTNESNPRSPRARASNAAPISPNQDRRQSFSPNQARRPMPGRAKSEPQVAKSSTPTRRPAASPQQPQQSPQPHIDPNLPSVLAVDDNQINLQLMVTFVRKIKHPYESAADGFLALEAYKRSAINPSTGKVDNSAPRRFRYILMDINMPRMDGSTATKLIRKFEKDNNLDPPVRIFALTGLGDLEQPWAKEAGFDRVLSKPIKFKELKDLLV